MSVSLTDAESPTKKWTCECNKQFTSKYTMKRHQDTVCKYDGTVYSGWNKSMGFKCFSWFWLYSHIFIAAQRKTDAENVTSDGANSFAKLGNSVEIDIEKSAVSNFARTRINTDMPRANNNGKKHQKMRIKNKREKFQSTRLPWCISSYLCQFIVYSVENAKRSQKFAQYNRKNRWKILSCVDTNGLYRGRLWAKSLWLCYSRFKWTQRTNFRCLFISGEIYFTLRRYFNLRFFACKVVDANDISSGPPTNDKSIENRTYVSLAEGASASKKNGTLSRYLFTFQLNSLRSILVKRKKLKDAHTQTIHPCFEIQLFMFDKEKFNFHAVPKCSQGNE